MRVAYTDRDGNVLPQLNLVREWNPTERVRTDTWDGSAAPGEGSTDTQQRVALWVADTETPDGLVRRVVVDAGKGIKNSKPKARTARKRGTSSQLAYPQAWGFHGPLACEGSEDWPSEFWCGLAHCDYCRTRKLRRTLDTARAMARAWPYLEELETVPPGFRPWLCTVTRQRTADTATAVWFRQAVRLFDTWLRHKAVWTGGYWIPEVIPHPEEGASSFNCCPWSFLSRGRPLPKDIECEVFSDHLMPCPACSVGHLHYHSVGFAPEFIDFEHTHHLLLVVNDAIQELGGPPNILGNVNWQRPKKGVPAEYVIGYLGKYISKESEGQAAWLRGAVPGMQWTMRTGVARGLVKHKVLRHAMARDAALDITLPYQTPSQGLVIRGRTYEAQIITDRQIWESKAWHVDVEAAQRDAGRVVRTRLGLAPGNRRKPLR